MLTWPALLVFAAVAGGESAAGPFVELRPLAVPALRARPAISPAKKAHLLKLIARLAAADRAYLGCSPFHDGIAFLPVPESDNRPWWSPTSHDLASVAPLRELISLGPDALPFLLDALDDTTPTKLTFTYGNPDDVFREGSMFLSDELPAGNLLNPREAKVRATPELKGKRGADIDTYVVKVGDLCFAAVGQIVGRPYLLSHSVLRCEVINSPVADASLRDRVRQIWASADPARTLYESLWTDYRTTGAPRGPDLFGWQHGSRFQRSAALRLLYYFPAEAAPVVTERLNKLDVAKAKEGTAAFNRQGVANGGIYADELIPAVAWCERPEVRAAVRGVFHRTTDAGVFSVAAPVFGKAERDVIVKKADALLAALTRDDRADRLPAFILGVAADRAGAASAPSFRRQMSTSDPAALGSLAAVLGKVKDDWPVELLKPLLKDERPTDRVYRVRDKNRQEPPVPAPLRFADIDDGYDKVPVRVCDAAAEALAERIPATVGTFPEVPDRKALDEYVARLREKLAVR